ncbi:hypothetical protein QIS74_12221 [Colletotrichum tabaci]|uniref:Uncharacterized protein n=1 Tax=Colletotrichum tabaci TaxID=1209068 RepID=A0AAV9SW42_9PEZI
MTAGLHQYAAILTLESQRDGSSGGMSDQPSAGQISSPQAVVSLPRGGAQIKHAA